MAAVGQVTLTSRNADAAHAWKIEAADGSQTAPAPAAHAIGTSVEMRELYFNTPARRKFLKSENTEFAWCEETFKRIALSRPDVAFSLQNNGRMVWQLAAQRVPHPALPEGEGYCDAPGLRDGLEGGGNTLHHASLHCSAQNSGSMRSPSNGKSPACTSTASPPCPPIRALPATSNISSSTAASCATRC